MTFAILDRPNATKVMKLINLLLLDSKCSDTYTKQSKLSYIHYQSETQIVYSSTITFLH